jgi:hypothetical protein
MEWRTAQYIKERHSPLNQLDKNGGEGKRTDTNEMGGIDDAAI